MSAAETESFLTDLAVDGNVAASTQNQALVAILVLYWQAREIALPSSENIAGAERSPRVPVVPIREATLALIHYRDGRTTQI